MSGNRAEYWDKVARVWHLKGYSNKLLAEHWRKTHLALVSRWADVANAGHILKTDLFQEAVGQVQFLFEVAQLNGNVIGIDVSSKVVDQAKRRATDIGMDAS